MTTITEQELVEVMARAMHDARPPRDVEGRLLDFHDPANCTAMNCAYDARVALSAIRAAGCEVVPREPDTAMISAGVSHRLSTSIGSDNRWPEDTAALYRAMLSASPLKGQADDRS